MWRNVDYRIKGLSCLRSSSLTDVRSQMRKRDGGSTTVPRGQGPGVRTRFRREVRR